MIETIQAGKHKLSVEEINPPYRGTRYEIRLENNVAISLGATKEQKENIIKAVKEGKYDNYIETYCQLPL